MSATTVSAVGRSSLKHVITMQETLIQIPFSQTLRKGFRTVDLVGKKYNRLTVIEYNGSYPNSYGRFIHRWKCRCDCGNESNPNTQSLENGSSQSCGCLCRERAGRVCAERNLTHGLSSTPEYRIWAGMIQRCNNTNGDFYHRYGARGIIVCQRWMTFENFLEDIGKRPSKTHSIERDNMNGNYEPNNCRWATKKEQARNTVTNRFIEIDGQVKCVAEWAEIMGLKYSSADRRFKHYKSMSNPKTIQPAP